MRRIWDISAPVSETAPVFPGDTPFAQTWAAQIGGGCPVNVSAITLSPHVGTHADAPLHYDPQGASSGMLDLTPYLGPCRVIHAMDCGPLIRWQHIGHATSGLPPRVLVRTYARMPVDRFDMQLSAFDPTTVEQLAARGVTLIGLDSASIDPAASKDLPSHMVIRRLGLRVLENLVLDQVPEGDYELIALPLKLMSADASPVRAILRELSP